MSCAQKHTSDRYGVGLQTDYTLRETRDSRLPSWPQCRLASSLMREGWRGHVCRCVRDRVYRRWASTVVVTRFLVGSNTGPPAGGSLCLVYARFMCTPHYRPVRTQCQAVLRQSAETIPLRAVSCSPPLDALVGAPRQIFWPRRHRDHAAFAVRRTRD